jgi:hypothetical protein
MGGLTQGLVKGAVVGFYRNQLIKCVFNLFLELLVFLMNRSPSIKNGGWYGITH